MAEHKILFTGTMGAGKTTAIGAISEITPISTDVKNNDASVQKALTTVGLDYGEVTLGNGDKVHLYGTPGQKRFDFMWKILARGALGLIILIDNSRPEPLVDLTMFVEGFKELIEETACVVVVGRTDTHPNPTPNDFSDHLASLGVLCPVIEGDVREAGEVLQALDLLLTLLDNKL
jgi:uncharacterized protein